MTRLAIFIDSLARGGTQTALVHLVQGLMQRDYSIFIYNLSGDTDPLHHAALCEAGAEVITIGKRALACGVGLVHILLTLRRFAPHTVLTLLEYADQIGRILGYMTKTPHIVSADRFLAKYRQRHILFCDALTARFAHHMTFNCRESLQQALDLGLTTPEKSLFIPNAVYLKEPSAPREALRQQWGMQGKALCALSRCVDFKRQDILLRSFAAISLQFPDLNLHLGGYGPLLHELKNLAHTLGIAPRVNFHGKVTAVQDFLYAGDLFVHTSEKEGMPNVVMEALASGLPVVATAVDGATDLILHEDSGLLIPPNSVEATATAMTVLLRNPDKAQNMGQRAAQRMRDHFSPSLFVQRYDDLLRIR